MRGDDLSAIAGPGLQTQDDLIIEAEGAIREMARLMCQAISELYGLESGDSIDLQVITDGDKLLGAVVTGAQVDIEVVPRFVAQGKMVH